ncbi:MAG TPA: hypothetical protein VFF40_12195 [Acidimicrobiia bacterium]|nr:hypothetical protein [Acidimicrobiia bacterium]
MATLLSGGGISADVGTDVAPVFAQDQEHVFSCDASNGDLRQAELG